MTTPTILERIRDWLAGRLIALGERLGGVYEECGFLFRDGSGYCALPAGHDGLDGWHDPPAIEGSVRLP